MTKPQDSMEVMAIRRRGLMMGQLLFDNYPCFIGPCRLLAQFLNLRFVLGKPFAKVR